MTTGKWFNDLCNKPYIGTKSKMGRLHNVVLRNYQAPIILV